MNLPKVRNFSEEYLRKLEDTFCIFLLFTIEYLSQYFGKIRIEKKLHSINKNKPKERQMWFKKGIYKMLKIN